MRNERVKLYKKISTWVLIGVIIAFMMVTTLLVRVISNNNNNYWEQNYRDNYKAEMQNYTHQWNEDKTNYFAKVSMEKYAYLLENDIVYNDWKMEVVEAYYDVQYNLELLNNAVQSEMPSESREVLEEQSRVYQSLLDGNDWKELIQLKIQILKGEVAYGEKYFFANSQSLETEDEKKVALEVLQLYLDYDVQPFYNTGRYWYGNSDSQLEQWKDTELRSIQAKKLNLLRGEDSETGVPLNDTSRQKLEQDIAISLAKIEADASPVKANSFLGLLESSASSVSLIAVILIVMAGGMIASEFSTGTVKLLLITPHKRREIFWAKALILLEITLISVLALFIVAFLFCGILTGFAGMGSMHVISLFGSVVKIPALLFVFMKYLLLLLPVLTYGALALMLSAVTRKSSVAVAVSMLLMFGSSIVTSILISLRQYSGIIVPGAKFIFACNSDLAGYLPALVSGGNMGVNLFPSGLVDTSMTLAFSFIIQLITLACFLWIARDSFCRRDVK